MRTPPKMVLKLAGSLRSRIDPKLNTSVFANNPFARDHVAVNIFLQAAANNKKISVVNVLQVKKGNKW